MSRAAFPPRRSGISVPVLYTSSSGRQIEYMARFNFHDDGFIRECFVSDTGKTGSDLSSLLDDGAIILSLLLQHGMTCEQVAASLGENRPEGLKNGPPSSPLGALARAGAELDSHASQVAEPFS